MGPNSCGSAMDSKPCRSPKHPRTQTGKEWPSRRAQLLGTRHGSPVSPRLPPLDSPQQLGPVSPRLPPLGLPQHPGPLSPRLPPLHSAQQPGPLSLRLPPVDSPQQLGPRSPCLPPLDSPRQSSPLSPRLLPLNSPHRASPLSPRTPPLALGAQSSPLSPHLPPPAHSPQASRLPRLLPPHAREASSPSPPQASLPPTRSSGSACVPPLDLPALDSPTKHCPPSAERIEHFPTGGCIQARGVVPSRQLPQQPGFCRDCSPVHADPCAGGTPPGSPASLRGALLSLPQDRPHTGKGHLQGLEYEVLARGGPRVRRSLRLDMDAQGAPARPGERGWTWAGGQEGSREGEGVCQGAPAHEGAGKGKGRGMLRCVSECAISGQGYTPPRSPLASPPSFPRLPTDPSIRDLHTRGGNEGGEGTRAGQGRLMGDGCTGAESRCGPVFDSTEGTKWPTEGTLEAQPPSTPPPRSPPCHRSAPLRLEAVLLSPRSPSAPAPLLSARMRSASESSRHGPRAPHGYTRGVPSLEGSPGHPGAQSPRLPLSPLGLSSARRHTLPSSSPSSLPGGDPKITRGAQRAYPQVERCHLSTEGRGTRDHVRATARQSPRSDMAADTAKGTPSAPGTPSTPGTPTALPTRPGLGTPSAPGTSTGPSTPTGPGTPTRLEGSVQLARTPGTGRPSLWPPGPTNVGPGTPTQREGSVLLVGTQSDPPRGGGPVWSPIIDGCESSEQGLRAPTAVCGPVGQPCWDGGSPLQRRSGGLECSGPRAPTAAAGEQLCGGVARITVVRRGADSRGSPATPHAGSGVPSCPLRSPGAQMRHSSLGAPCCPPRSPGAACLHIRWSLAGAECSGDSPSVALSETPYHAVRGRATAGGESAGPVHAREESAIGTLSPPLYWTDKSILGAARPSVVPSSAPPSTPAHASQASPWQLQLRQAPGRRHQGALPATFRLDEEDICWDSPLQEAHWGQGESGRCREGNHCDMRECFTDTWGGCVPTERGPSEGGLSQRSRTEEVPTERGPNGGGFTERRPAEEGLSERGPRGPEESVEAGRVVRWRRLQSRSTRLALPPSNSEPLRGSEGGPHPAHRRGQGSSPRQAISSVPNVHKILDSPPCQRQHQGIWRESEDRPVPEVSPNLLLAEELGLPKWYVSDLSGKEMALCCPGGPGGKGKKGERGEGAASMRLKGYVSDQVTVQRPRREVKLSAAREESKGTPGASNGSSIPIHKRLGGYHKGGLLKSSSSNGLPMAAAFSPRSSSGEEERHLLKSLESEKGPGGMHWTTHLPAHEGGPSPALNKPPGEKTLRGGSQLAEKCQGTAALSSRRRPGAALFPPELLC